MTIEHAGPFLESGLFAGARANVMFALCNYADDYGECWPSHEAVGIAARCSRETSGREIAFLARHGVVEILKGDERPPEKRRLAGRSNVYRVNLALVRAMYFLVAEAKRLAGRDPARRYGAVRAVADWAEQVIEDHGPAGAAEFVRQASERLAKGEIMTLLGDLPPPVSCDVPSHENPLSRDVPSHENPLSRDDREVSCDGTSHYPSIEPPYEPSRARGGSAGEVQPPRGAGDGTARASTGAGKAGRGDAAAPETVNERAEREARLIARWIALAPVDRFALLRAGLWAERREPNADETATALFSASTAGLKKIVSWLDWAQRVRDGRETNTIEPIRDIVAATRDAPKGGEAPAGLAARLALCALSRAAAAREALRARLSAEGGDGPDGKALQRQGPEEAPADDPPADDHHDPPDAAAA